MGVDHPLSAPPPPAKPILLQYYCTTIAQCTPPHRPLLCMPYTIQYWLWQYRVKVNHQPTPSASSNRVKGNPNPNLTLTLTIAILVHDYCAVYASLSTPLLYAIPYTILVMAISCKGQLRYCTRSPCGTR